MIPQLRMLLWKEWRERWDQFLYCLAWVIGAVIDALFGTGTFAENVATMALPYCILMPILVGMRTALSEQSDRSLSFSLGLPSNPALQASLRLLGGWLALVVPVAISGGIFVALDVWGSRAKISWLGRNHWNELVLAAAAFAWTVSGLYLLVSLLGTWVRSEMRLGSAAVIVAIVFWLNFSVGVFFTKVDTINQVLWLPTNILSLNVFGIFEYLDNRVSNIGSLARIDFLTHYRTIWIIWAPLALNALVQCSQAILFVRRYGQSDLVPGDSGAQAVHRRSPLAMPVLRSTNLALGWLTLRQTLPLCLPGLVVICLIVLTLGGLQGRNDFSQGFAPVTAIVGVLWSVIVGAGIFSDEIDSRLGESWRAWPLSVGRLFFIKYFVGLFSVLIVLEAPTVAIDLIYAVGGSWTELPLRGYLTCMLPLHTTLFSLALALSCILRRSTLAAMAALTLYLFVISVLFVLHVDQDYEPLTLALNSYNGVRYTSMITAVAMGLITLVSAAIGYLAFARGGSRGLWLWALDRLAYGRPRLQPAEIHRLE
jgi:hypothetical protein